MKVFELFSELGLDNKTFITTLDQSKRDMKTAGGDITKESEGMSRKAKIAFTAAAATMAVATKAGSEIYLGGLHAIRTETGATGKELEALETIMRNVAKSGVTTEIGEVGEVIGELGKRTDLTGPSLERLTRKVVILSELTGGDASDSVEGLVDVYKKWEVATADQAGLLDVLFRAQQRSGVGVEKMLDLLGAGAATLKNFGFSLDQSIAFIAQIEKEGGDASAVLQALKLAFVALARSGKDPVEAFASLSVELKEAKTNADATRIASDALGFRAGPLLAGMIRSGRFEVEDFAKALDGSTDTIEKAREETLSFTDRLEQLRNKVIATTGPLLDEAAVVATIVSGMVPLVSGTINVVKWFKALEMTTVALTVKTRALQAVQLSPWLAVAAGAAYSLANSMEAANGQIEKAVKEGTGSSGGALLYVASSLGLVDLQAKKSAASSQEFTDVLDSVSTGLDKVGRTVVSTTQAVARHGEFVEKTGRKYDRFADMGLKKFNEWRGGTVDNFNIVEGALDRLASRHKVTADQILRQLDRALTAQLNFGDNWRTVVRRAGEGGEDFVKMLQEKYGAEAPALIAALANTNKAKFDDIVGKWLRAGKSADSLSRTTGQAFGKIPGALNPAQRAVDRFLATLRGISAFSHISITTHFREASVPSPAPAPRGAPRGSTRGPRPLSGTSALFEGASRTRATSPADVVQITVPVRVQGNVIGIDDLAGQLTRALRNRVALGGGRVSDLFGGVG